MSIIKPFQALFVGKNNFSHEEFDSLYQKYYSIIYKHAAYLTGNLQTAEDIAQETFIKLYNAPPSHSNVIAWLTKVSSNLAYNQLRSMKTRVAKEPDILEDTVSNVISIEDAAIKNQEIRITRKVLNALPARDRMCLLLKFSGYKYTEIADALDMEFASVGTTLARAQAKFKDRYEKEVQGK